MPIITLNYEDLEGLVGTDRDTIIQRVPMIGADIERSEDDHIDIEFFPDRPDLYSVEGVARAMRGFLEIETGGIEYPVSPSGVTITMEPELHGIRPVLGAAIVRGIKFNDNSIASLMDMQEDLHWGLGRNRKKVSVGVHDLANIKAPFKYMAVDPDYEFVPLDFTEPMSMREILEKHPKGTKFAHLLDGFDKYPLIVDSENNVVSFPPIINGTLTRVTNDTTDLLIEVTGLAKEVFTTLNIIVSALYERGGIIESVDVIGAPASQPSTTPDLTYSIRRIAVDEVKALIGIEMSAAQVAQNLEKMRYGATVIDDNTVEVEVPPYRADILHTYDLIEDIAIGYGYDKIEPVFPKTATVGKAHPLSITKANIMEIMVGLGYTEVMPFTLTNDTVHFDNMCRPKTGTEDGGDSVTYVKHPISSDHTMLRTTILPNLFEIIALNQHRELPQRIFEVGEVVISGKNVQKLAGVSVHSQANFTEILSIVDAIMRERAIEYEVKESEDGAFIEGRRADIIVGEYTVGSFGEVSPEVIANFGMANPMVAFEIVL